MFVIYIGGWWVIVGFGVIKGVGEFKYLRILISIRYGGGGRFKMYFDIGYFGVIVGVCGGFVRLKFYVLLSRVVGLVCGCYGDNGWWIWYFDFGSIWEYFCITFLIV